MLSESKLQTVIDHGGFDLSFAGITIVFVSLVSISIFIAMLPRILKVVDKIFPPKEEPKPRKAATPKSDSLEEVAAIAYALHKSGRSN